MKDSRTYVATLRNMWVSVAFFNPVLGALAMAVLPMSSIYTYTSNLLGPMAAVVGGVSCSARAPERANGRGGGGLRPRC